MARTIQSIFQRKAEAVLSVPDKDKPLMRVLEPRILLDAASVETALDIAGQAAHLQLADDYMASAGPASGDIETAGEAGEDKTSPQSHSPLSEDEFAEDLGASPRRTDREIVFIDAGVENVEGLIASLEPGVSIHILETETDGVRQIADILSQSGGYDAVHIFSHGAAGVLQLGDTTLDSVSIETRHRQALVEIGEALSETGDILIYGCDFGQGVAGQKAANMLAAITGADVAASDDLTGSESLSGDWDLEVKTGHVQSQAFTLPDWQGILAGFELQATTQPTIGHLDDGIVGTANTTATWSNAATFDPGGGGAIQTYDIRATLIGMTDNMSATFETVASTNPSMDDFRVVVTNIGAVVGSSGGQDILEEGSVATRWAIYEAGTDTLAPPQALNVLFTDIEGLAGAPDTRESVAIESEEIVSYTVNAGSDLQTSSGPDGLTAVGTEQGTGAVGSQLGVTWASANQFIVSYSSRTLITNFDFDGDRDMTVFPTPVTTRTQVLDLNGAAAGEDYTTTYLNHAKSGIDADVPLALTDVDLSIYDFDSEFLVSATITLTNALAGDQFNYDAALLNSLGLTPSFTDTGSELILNLTGFALISNYETALQSLSYSNDNPDGTFDRVTDRVFEFEIFDGVITTGGVQTTVNFGTAALAPVAGTNVYVEDEDIAIIANAANGLLADDADPQGDVITVIGATDSLGAAIVIGVTHTTPTGAALTLNSDGSFTYIPASNYSGNETITYTVSDGAITSTSYATFDIQPVIDNVTLSVTQPSPLTNEDVVSNTIDVSSLSLDTSEVQRILATNIPNGVILTDGLNSFTAGNDVFEVEVTNWDRTQLRVLPVQNSDIDVVIIFVAENYEIDGTFSFDSQSVTFQVDAVADTPLLIVEQAFGEIDQDILLADIISVQLFDVDGSETLTDITISNLPVGGQLLVNGVPLPVVGNSSSFGPLDIPNLVFRPPVTGADAVYNLSVSATATETGAENGVAQLSATRSGVGLRIELNDDNDPVVAVDDQASTFAGESVDIDVLQNDFVPDGSPVVTEINGIPIDVPTPVTLPGGQGVVSLSPFGYLVFAASNSFAGEVQFTYTVQDQDLSVDTGVVTVAVQPRWALSSDPSVLEGNSARFVVKIEGAIAQGDTITADLVLEEGTATAADHATLIQAISDSLVAYSRTDFSFDGTTLSYSAPATNYTSSYEPAGAGNFLDISATGDAVNLGNDGISSRNLGFNFDFYADTFSDAYISANGYLTFGSPGVGTDNVDLDGTALSARPIIAPFWDDLNTASGSVYMQTIGAIEGQRQFVVQWEGVQNQSDGSGTGSFQVVLDEATNQIQFNYRDVIFDGVGDNGAGASIGLQSPDSVFDQFSFNDGANIANNGSITFSRASVENVELLIDVPIVDDSIFEDVEDFGLRLSNSVNSSIGTDNTSVSIQVSDNAAPVANNDTITSPENGTGTINVITNLAGLDTDAEGHSLQIAELEGVAITGGTAVNLPSGATVGVNLNGSLVYNPNGAFSHLGQGQVGNDTFTYRVVDAFGAVSATLATVSINIIGENQSTVVDLDDDGATSATTNSITYGPLETTMNIAAANAVIIDPDDTTVASVSLALAGFNQPGNEKISFNGVTATYGTALNSTVTVGGTLFSIVYDGAFSITLTRSGGGEMPVADLQALVRTITYENDSNDDTRGNKTISFTIDDGNGAGPTSVAEIYVVGNNVDPVAGDDGTPTAYVTVEDTAILIPVAQLLLNDTDVDFNPLDIIAVDGGANGSAVLDGGGNVVYTPDPDFTGTTSFTYTLDDGDGGQDTGSVFMDVTPVNDAPRLDLDGGFVGTGYAFTYVENDLPTSIIAVSGALNDVDNANLTGASIVLNGGQIDDVFNFGSLPPSISATLVPAEAATGLTATATVTIQFSGAASVAVYETAIRSITYSNLSDVPSTAARTVSVSATDGTDTSLVATTTITVQQVNDAPVTGADGPLGFAEDTSITITPAILLANDSDADGDAMTITSVQSPVNGTVITNGFGDFVFTPDANYFGAASFTYTVEDGQGGVAVETVSLTVTAVNDATVITLDTGSGDGNYAIGYTENGPGLAVVSPSVALQDVDNTTLVSATVTLNNGQIGDLLEHGSLPAGITAFIAPAGPLVSAGPITVTLNGVATLADYQTALQLVTYRSNSDAPSIINRDISINVNDGTENSNVGTTTVAVTAVNDQPIAVDDNSISFIEDSSRIISPAELTGNDSDPDGDSFTISSVQSPVNGTVVLNGNGTITFTPPADYFGPASFTYTIDDGNGEQATATVNLTVTSVNDATQVDLDTNVAGTGFTTAYIENAPGVALVDPTIQLLDVDHVNLASATITLTNGQIGDLLEVGALPGGIFAAVAPNTALLAPGLVTVTLSGTASLADYQTALGAVTYRSNSDAPSLINRQIDIATSDGIGPSNTATTTVTVTGVNDQPVATANAFAVDEDTPLTLLPAALVFDDSDLDGDALTITSVGSAVNGTVIIDGSGNVVFTPGSNYSGPASFSYTIDDGNGGTASATVNITVNAVNDAPVIDLDSNTVGSGFTGTFVENATAVLIVDPTISISDVDGPTLTGATVILSNGQVGDLIVVGGLPAGITATTIPSTVLVATGTLTVQLSGTGDAATYQAALQAITYQSVSENPNTIPRSFSVTVTDGVDTSVSTVSTINVTAINDAPTAGDDGVFSFDEDTLFVIPAASLLSNDTDLEADALTIVSVQSAVNGSVTLNAGVITFTPNIAYFGPASFTYTVDDGNGGSDVATVNLFVNILNDAPILNLDLSAAGFNFTTGYTENGTGVGIVDTDVDIFDQDHTNLASATVTLSNGQIGDILEVGALPGSITAVVTPAVGLNTPGSITVTFSGSATLAQYQTALQAVTYRSLSEDPDTTDRTIGIIVSDGLDPSAVATTTISVTAVNDAPVAADDGSPTALIATEDTPFIYDPVVANDTDFENDALTITQINGFAISPGGSIALGSGNLELGLNGTTFTFTPAANYFGPVSFTYTLSDGALTDTATVAIDVISINDAPDARDDGPVVLVEDGFVFFDPVTANDTDVENDPLNIIAVDGQPITPTASVTTTSGQITLGTDGRTLQFVPNANFNGNSVVVYTIDDGQHSSTAQITFAVTPVDDPVTIVSPVADITLNDSDIVNLPLAGYFDDPDNDGLLFTAAGLPPGLSIHATSGIVSGVLDSSASQSGPYTITVSADDGVSSVVSDTFTMNVLNVAPVANPDMTETINDGATLNFAASTLFVDADNDALSYSATGLPVWMNIDSLSGAVTGTIPSDASVFGAFPVTITVADTDGATASIDVTFDPQNPAPVATSTLGNITAQEDDALDLDINGLFIDGGSDNDALSISVSGLPDGIAYDQPTGRISGHYATGSGSVTPYNVVVTADDGQGGVTNISFSILVGNSAFVEEQDPLVSLDELIEFEPETAPEEDSFEQSAIGNVVDGIAPLGGIAGLTADTGILLSAISQIDPLYEATLSGSNAGIPDQMDAMDAMAQSTDWLSDSGRQGNGDWDVTSTFVSMSLMEDQAEDHAKRDVFKTDERLDRLLVDVVRRQGGLYIEFKDQFNPDRDGRIIRTVFSYPDGKPLPEWMKVVREGFISATPPADISEISLTVSVTLDNGNILSKQVLIDVLTGASIDADAFENENKVADDNHPKKVAFGVEDLRGTLPPNSDAR